MNDTRPMWLRTERVLWTEDDATRSDPSAEKIHRAWLRLFNSELESETKVDEYDGGDTTWTLFASGRIASYSYCGTEISIARITGVV